MIRSEEKWRRWFRAKAHDEHWYRVRLHAALTGGIVFGGLIIAVGIASIINGLL